MQISLFYLQESLLQKFDFFVVALIIFVPHLALIIRDFRGQIAGYFSRQGGQRSEVSGGNAIEMANLETGMKHEKHFSSEGTFIKLCLKIGINEDHHFKTLVMNGKCVYVHIS